MLHVQKTIAIQPSLDRESWHKPLVSVIITHFNYSDYLRDAILSLLDQTHENWECVIVDDGSAIEHQERLQEIITSLGCSRVKALYLLKNAGQIPAFFAGLDNTRGEFVCLLDPDDRYAETFLEESLNAHLNKFVVCPITSTEQYALTERGITAAAFHHDGKRCLTPLGQMFRVEEDVAPLIFIPRHVPGWHWGTTSSMMFRRSALKYLRPHRALTYKGEADAYLASGAHLLGGTLFLHKPLVYRTLHGRNTYIAKEIFSSLCDNMKSGAVDRSRQCRADAMDALVANNAPLDLLSPQTVLSKDKRLIAKWKRSISKRRLKLLKLLGVNSN